MAACRTSAMQRVEDKQRRPEEIELLFHAEGPKVLEGPDVVVGKIVVGEGERGEQVAAIHAGDAAECSESADEEHVDVEGRKDAEGAAKVEAGETDGAGAGAFAEKQCGDEVARDDEEDQDAVFAIAEEALPERNVDGDMPSEERVRDHDEDDREGAQAIEAGDVAGAINGCGCEGSHERCASLRAWLPLCPQAGTNQAVRTILPMPPFSAMAWASAASARGMTRSRGSFSFPSRMASA